MHFGFGWKQQDYRGESIKLKQGAESDWIQDKYVSTKIKHVDTVNTFNLEAMGIYNKYYMQAEYSRENVSADKGDYSFYAYYLQGSYFLIGEGKRYKVATATMAKIKPRAEGALELAMRYSYINLTDKDEQGGQQQDVTLGVNWYIDDKLKVSANYILANPIDTEDYDGIFQVWQARVLFFF
jgi:phosphate-selective porin OprO/OprP